MLVIIYAFFDSEIQGWLSAMFELALYGTWQCVEKKFAKLFVSFPFFPHHQQVNSQGWRSIGTKYQLDGIEFVALLLRKLHFELSN